MAILKIKPAKSDQEQEFPLEGDRVTIGRGLENTCSLEDLAASRHHAEISAMGPSFLIKDLGSSNGTWVNRERIETHQLVDGDEIRIGETTLTFSDPQWEKATIMVDLADMVDLAEIQDVEVTQVQSTPAQASPQPPPAAPPIQAPPLAVAPPAVAPPAVAPPAIAPPAVTPPAVAPPREMSPPPMPAARAPALPVAPPPPPVGVAQAAVRPSSARVSGGSAARAGETAGFGIRLGAYLIDSIILSIAVMLVMVPTGILAAVIGPKSQGFSIFVTLVGWLLGMAVGIGYLLVPWARSGVTPGKKMLKLKIVREDGVEPLGYGKAALRLLGYMASGAILYIGFIMVAFTDGHKGLHDMIAGTRVVKT